MKTSELSAAPRPPKITAICNNTGEVTHIEILHTNGNVTKHDVTNELDAVFPREKLIERALLAAFIGPRFIQSV